MDFILRKIEKKIKQNELLGKKEELKEFYKSRSEYLLFFLLGYLWNKNYKDLEDNKKKKVAQDILKPTIGGIIYLLDDLDIQNEFFSNNNIKKLFLDYNKTRNDRTGHGYTYEDGREEYIDTITQIHNLIVNSNLDLISNDINFVKPLKLENDIYTGFIYYSNGDDDIWSCWTSSRQ